VIFLRSEEHRALPRVFWRTSSSLEVVPLHTNLGGYVANVTEERLQNAPEYAGEESWSDRDWEIRLNKNYGAAPYGEDTTISTSKGDESPRGGW